MEWTGRVVREVRRRGAAAVETVRLAWAGPGRERDLVAQAGKAALAAWVAWAVAGWWLAAPMAFVAPWVAVVLVESTVYRSLAHGLQQLAAIAVGTVVATGAALVLDSTMVTMALVLPTVLLLGQWQRLGSQGVYAATGALFVLTGGQATVAAAGARIAEAVFGAVVGVVVNALIRPPVYLRDTRAALQDAAIEAEEILDAVADGLAAGEWDGHQAGEWHERALRLGRLVDQARSAIGWSRESMRVNPRGRRRHATAPPGKAYADALAVLDYVAVHTSGVTRTVWETADHGRKAARPAEAIARPYADFLRRTAQAVRLYGRTRFAPSGHDDSAAEELREAVGELHRSLDAFRRRLPGAVADDPDALVTYGTLLAQAHRLADQLVQD
ncbi:aromatic acid exporter family protein [Streptomyces sp. NBC_00487]|uniref:aromatic acid exporter family protein n=1 Tax=unclassified Streptomyces TaxID=2593676 RepID=UPI002E17560B|nr:MULTISPECIES: aromatic acid exporter family protein [unclassified Streptomyces]